MIPFFAEADVNALPAWFIKYAVIAFLVCIAAGAGVAVIVDTFRKKKVEIEPQPVEVRKAPKQFNHDLAEERHRKSQEKLTDHEERIQILEQDRGALELRIVKSGEERELRLRSEIRQAEEKTSHSLSRLHDRINQVIEGVARIAGKK